MVGLEFYIFEDELWCRSADGRNFLVEETCTEIISYILNNVRERYPEAYKALEKWYMKSAVNTRYYQYLMAKRFCKCNFANLDTTREDVQSIGCDGAINFEKVCCPMRGECPYEGVVCMPKFDTRLSPAEKRVMRLFYEGKEKEEIGELLFVSPGTVKNQIKSAYLKLGVHSRPEFVKYANDNNIFQTD